MWATDGTTKPFPDMKQVPRLRGSSNLWVDHALNVHGSNEWRPAGSDGISHPTLSPTEGGKDGASGFGCTDEKTHPSQGGLCDTGARSHPAIFAWNHSTTSEISVKR